MFDYNWSTRYDGDEWPHFLKVHVMALWRYGVMALWRYGVLIACVLMVTSGCSEEDWASLSTDVAESPVIWEPGATWKPPSAFALDAEYWPATQYARASGVVVFRLPDGRSSWCSASLIGSYKVATAHHCVGHLGPFESVKFVPSFFDPVLSPVVEARSSTDSTLRGLLALGFRGADLDDALNIVQDFGDEWKCYYEGQDGTSDVAYLECELKWVATEDGSLQFLAPGDIYGFMDVNVVSPVNKRALYTVSVNRRVSDANPAEVLVSPNGVVETNVNASCSIGYTHCTTTQGADALPGSSGGAYLTTSDHRMFGVHSGSSRPVPIREPQCYGRSGCYSSKGIAARMSVMAYEDRHFESPGLISSVPKTAYTARYASSTLGSFSALCAKDEVMTGIIGSYKGAFASTSLDLGTLGTICSSIGPGMGVQFNGSTYVQVKGGSNTSYTQTPAASSINRETLNRYRNTVKFATWVAFIPAVLPQRENMCPGGTAVYKVSAVVRSGHVVGIQSMGCRRPDGSGFDLDLSSSTLNSSTSGSIVTRSCSGNRVAIGQLTWVGDKVEDMQLACRDW